jgi:phospholipid/cholesterol/gamma-HCH transport system substrate-binding protein
MGEQTKNMLIGAFIIGACTLIISMVMFLKPTVGDGRKTIYVRFANINKVNIGTRVTFAGKPVGEVVAIEQIYDARQKPSADMLGQIYFYQLVLHIDSHVKVYDTDEISIQTSGLLGEKSIAIIPKIPPKGVVPRLITNQPIYAQSYDPIEYAFTELSDLATHMKTTINEINNWVQSNGASVASAVRSFGAAMDEVKIATKTINDEHVIHSLKTGIENFSNTLTDIQAAIHQMSQDNVFVNVGTLVKNLTSASHSVDLITQDIADGKGTIGKLVKWDDTYLRFTAILSKADTLMNDINHYGLMFNLNKSWQRQRLQRITVLNALNTPEGFKQYFEGEVDGINTAMARLSMLIDKAEQSPERQEILNNGLFRKDFAELLRDVQELLDNLQLYNQQLTEALDKQQ